MTSEEIVALSREHTFFSWSVQGALDPIAIDHAEGVYLYTPEGQRILDFNSQLMSVNIGHGDRRVIDAITAQATKLQYVQPAFATEIRARLGAEAGRDPAGRHGQGLLHARRRRGDRERDQARPPRTPAGTRSSPATARTTARRSGAMTLTGDPRRWANEPGLVGVVRYPDTHRWGEAEPRPVAESLQGLEDVIRYEGAAARSRRSSSRRSSARTASSSRPTATSQGVREICDRNDILMVADEVMAGFGRTGRWFAVDHWDVTPDLMTMAKGLTSARTCRSARSRCATTIAEKFETKMFYGGLTYSSHPVSLRRGARHDRRLRGGRPDRATPPGSAPVMREPPRAPRRRSTRASARRATSACSGSSTSSGAATRGRR